MKKYLTSLFIICTILLSGCSSGKNASAGGTETSGSNTPSQRVEVKTDFQPVKPGTLPKLSQDQKAKVDSKLNSTLKSIDDTLNSLQDAPEIDLNSIN